MHVRLPVAALAAALASLAAAASAAPSELEPLAVVGGQLADPVAVGDRVYLPMGRGLVVLERDLADGGETVGRGVGLARGPISGVVHVGGYLHATWRRADGRSGLATWSLADAGAPVLVSDQDAPAPYGFSTLTAIAAVDGALVLFDSDNGLLHGSLQDPSAPQLTATGILAPPAGHVAVDGHFIRAFGKGWIGASLATLDANNPAMPYVADEMPVDGVTVFSTHFAAPWAIGAGAAFTVFDLSDPAGTMVQRSQVADGPLATQAVLLGQRAYTMGFDGLDVWNVADPDAPFVAAHADIDTLGTDAALAGDDAMLLFTQTDRAVRVDATAPDAPVATDEVVLPVGTSTYDVALAGDRLLLVQNAYGLSVAEADTLAPVARWEADLPPSLQARAFEAMTVVGDIAYVSSWGSGLYAVDISDPDAPVQVDYEPFDFAAESVADGAGHLFVVRATNDTGIGVFELDAAGLPSFRGLWPMTDNPLALAVDDGILYAPVSGQDGGLYVLDMRNPDAPVQLAHYTDGCTAPSDVVLEPARERAYVACDEGVQVLDVGDPAQPVRLASVPGVAWSSGRLALQDGLLWFADSAGLGAWDVRAEGTPVAVAHADLAGDVPVRLRVLADGRLAVPARQAGLHLFEAPALPDTPATPLGNGVLVRDLHGAAGDTLLYRVDLPEGARRLRVLSAGGSGDVSLSIRRGAAPTDTEYDARSLRPGNNETVSVDVPAAGTWYVRVHGGKPFARLTLRASWTTP